MFKKTAISILALLALTGAACTSNQTTPEGSTNSTASQGSRIPLNDIGSQEEYAIRLTSPQEGQVVKSPFLVGGEAIVPGENAYIRIKNTSGDVLISEDTRIKQEQGSDAGPFGVLISYVFQSTERGVVEVYAIDPATGSEIALESVAVNFDTSSNGSTQTPGQ